MQSNTLIFVKSAVLSFCQRRFVLASATSLDRRGQQQYSVCCCTNEQQKTYYIVPNNVWKVSKNYYSIKSIRQTKKINSGWGVEGEPDQILTIEEAFRKNARERVTKYNEKWTTKKNKDRKQRSAIKRTVKEYHAIKDSTYNEILQEFPEIEEMDPDQVKEAMACAAFYGFSPTKVAKMLSRCPEVLENYANTFLASAKAWRRVGFSELDRVSLFVKNPELMYIPIQVLTSRYVFLSEYFSKNELVELIKNNPQVLSDDEHLLRNKINLLWKKYSHSTLAIGSSQAITRSVNEIMVRHEFLIRTGHFKAMPFHKFLKMQADEDMRRIVKQRDRYFNPTLINCTGDEKFLAKCTDNTLTVYDLMVFEEVFKREQAEEHFQELEELERLDGAEDLTPESYDDEEDDELSEDQPLDETDPRYRIRNSTEAFSEKDTVDAYF